MFDLDSHKVKRTVGDQKKFFVCIHQPLKEPSHIRSLFYVLFDMFAHNSMHYWMAK